MCAEDTKRERGRTNENEMASSEADKRIGTNERKKEKLRRKGMRRMKERRDSKERQNRIHPSRKGATTF